MAVEVAQLGRDADLCELVRVLEDASADDATKANAARALWMFAVADDDNTRAAVAAAGVIPRLVELLSGNLDEGRTQAAEALGNLAIHDDTAAAIMAAGAILPLVEMLSGSSDEGRAVAARALANLAARKKAYAAVIVWVDAIPPLVELLCSGGSAEGRQFAGRALYNLTKHNAGRREVEGLGYTQVRLRELM
jgi:hypothetical protein